MKKFIVITLSILAGLIIVVVGAGFFFLSPDKDVVLNFIKENPQRSSITLMRNDTVLASVRGDIKFPLASAVKTIIAIEFAQQVASHKIDPHEKIDTALLELFYIPNTDGGAHPQWKKTIKQFGLLDKNYVPLEEVAKGMIQFSSNANTEFLLWKLGIDNVNSNLKKLGLTQHDPLYPIVSALFVFSNNEKTDPKEFLKQCKEMSMDAYVKKCMAIHEKLKADASDAFKKKFVFPSMDLQRIWSDRLPASTTHEYASLMNKINSRSYFPADVQPTLDNIMEWPMRVNPANKQVYQHLGMKGGSTAFVLTQSMYVTSVKGNRTEVAFFFNDLNVFESMRLKQSMNDFMIACVSPKTCYAIAKELESLK